MGLAQKFLITGNTTITPPVYLIKTNQLHTLCITPSQWMTTMNLWIAKKPKETCCLAGLLHGSRLFFTTGNQKIPYLTKHVERMENEY